MPCLEPCQDMRSTLAFACRFGLGWRETPSINLDETLTAVAMPGNKSHGLVNSQSRIGTLTDRADRVSVVPYGGRPMKQKPKYYVGDQFRAVGSASWLTSVSPKSAQGANREEA